MFRNRRTSQKPSDDLYKNFKANFPHLVNQFGDDHTAASAPPHAQNATSLVDALDVPLNSRTIDYHNTLHNDLKDAGSTPRATHENWNVGSSTFTPSMMDPSSHTFNMFASQMPGYYTPTPGGTNTLYHPQAGDLHTPGIGMGMGMGTPLSMPTSEGAMHVGQQAFHVFQPHLAHHLQQQQFQNVNPFQIHAPATFAPQHFSHETSFDSAEGALEGSPIDDIGIDLNSHHHQQKQRQHQQQSLLQSQHQRQRQHLPSSTIMYSAQDLSHTSLKPPLQHPAGERFRYHVTLNAPTAMVKTAEEIPITYLNKGQAYALNIIDTHGQQYHSGQRYRTFVRVSFEDEQQRQRPAACWQLWKEGRGTNEAHQRGGRLQAVEFVEPNQLNHNDDVKQPQIELQESSFDGFCVIWSPSVSGSECTLSVRFNFLSTDFSHSKGVKGIPVRLCAKTEAIADDNLGASRSQAAEVCYCKVKLFRDHGAERKLSNDVSHVKKTIDKLKQQISQIEQGLKDFGKRKRSGSVARNSADARPTKMIKHRRTWSVSSTGGTQGRSSAEDDMHAKLRVLQDMFTSTRTNSVLYLVGDAEDDPDNFPVSLTGGDMADDVRAAAVDGSGWEQQSQPEDEDSPASSLPTQSSPELRKDSTIQPLPYGAVTRSESNEWRSHPQTALDIQPTIMEDEETSLQGQPPLKRIKTGTHLGSIQVAGIDPTYEPPPERTVKPVACFFILPSVAGKTPPDHFYRAVYLTSRTLKDFVAAMARKCNVEPTSVVRTYRVVSEDTLVLFDDDCIRELSEGQAMSIDFGEVHFDSTNSIKREWNSNLADVQCDGDIPLIETTNSVGYELRLVY